MRKSDTSVVLGSFFVFFLAVFVRFVFLIYGYVPKELYLKYIYLSRNLFTPAWWHGHVFFSSPGYQFFLYFFDHLLQLNDFQIRIIQLLIGSLACLVLSYIVMKEVSFRSGLAVGIISALYSHFILHEVVLNTSALDFLLNALLVFFLYNYIKKHNLKDVFAAGISLGLASILRPNALIMFFLLLLSFFFPSIRNKVKFTFKACLLLIIGLILPILPVTLLNMIAGGEFVFITASSGNLLYSGNSYYANGLTYSPPESMLFKQNENAVQSNTTLPVEHLMFWENAKEATNNMTLSASASSRFWTKETIRFMFEFPKHSTKLLFLKACYFWNSYASHDISEILYNENQLKKFPFLTFILIVPFGLTGLLFSFITGKWRNWILFIIPIFAYWISVIMVFSVDRYRLPAFPFVIVFAVLGIRELIFIVNMKHYKLLFLFLLIFLSSVFLTTMKTDAINFSKNVTAPIFLLEQKAIKSMKEHDWITAEKYFRKIIAIDPGSAQLAHQNLAIIASIRGDKTTSKREKKYAMGYIVPEKGKAFYNKRLLQNPDDYEALVALGSLEWANGNQQDALMDFNKALVIAPWWPAAHFNRGIVLLYGKRNNPEEALNSFEKAWTIGLSFSPQAANILYHIGVCYLKMNKNEKAKFSLEKSLKLAPHNKRTIYLLNKL